MLTATTGRSSKMILLERRVIFILLFVTMLIHLTQSKQFNYEIEKRIREHLDFFLSGPIESVTVLKKYRDFGGFPYNLEAADRDRFLKLAYSVTFPLIYVGLEDGTLTGYFRARGYYREPGNSGYSIDEPGERAKHLYTCIDATTGEAAPCLMQPGADYISCVGGDGDVTGLCPLLEPCPNQPDCADDDDECQQNLKWCRQYETLQVPDQDAANSTGYGYIPATFFCINGNGDFSQEVGDVLNPTGDNRTTLDRTTCTYGDGTIVERHLEGDFAACGPNTTCDTVFQGGYLSVEYDPRYRPWYTTTRELQTPNWLPPYSFFTLGLGVTYSMPLYNTDSSSGKQVFAGVLAVDYRFEDIFDFLVESYGQDTDRAIIIYESEEPNYVVASSTGTLSSRFMLSSNLSQVCPPEQIDESQGTYTGCEPVRIPVLEFGEGDAMDEVLVEAARIHEENGYIEELFSVKASSNTHDTIFVTQATTYAQSGAELSWRVVVVESGAQSTDNTITIGHSLFPVVLAIGGVGVAVCSYFFCAMYLRRKERVIIFADWRFTCAFIFGCILCNMSTFTLLGANTSSMCLLRMWSFHLAFVLTLSPLFVKVWRMYKLVGSPTIQRTTINNNSASLRTIPMILVQVALLTIFSIVDPPRPQELVEQEFGTFVHSVECQTDSPALVITMATFEALIVFWGCILAYTTRNMNDEFGEAKQMVFAMYNIFFVGLIVVIVIYGASLTGNERSIIQAVGVFWGTALSAAAFVIPRLFQARRVRSSQSSSQNMRVTGMGANAVAVRVSGIGASSNDRGTPPEDDIIQEESNGGAHPITNTIK